ncbi:MAG: response regulator [Candidatus Hodarchaeales archaeon]|jgi:DNA-binding NtrC family response regulator
MNNYVILHVDDQPSYLEITKIFLNRFLENIEIMQFESPKKALNFIFSNKVDLIISDCEMPEFTGIDLLFLLRTSGIELPFILCTGKGRKEIAIKAKKLGADYYLQKGFDIISCMLELSGYIRKEMVKKEKSYCIKKLKN